MSELPWTPPTPQDKGRTYEKKAAKDRGARAHPQSGAGRIKDDASTDDIQYEIKHCMATHTLHGTDLKALFNRATRQGKDAIYVVHFERLGITAECYITKDPQR